MAREPGLFDLPDQAHRETIAHDLRTTLLVEAAAGTGKTTSMIRRMVELLAEGECEIGTMAAVTFTRKATAELRDRFRMKLEAGATEATGKRRERLAAALAGIEQCFIGTIHAFCGRLLRERPIEAGIDVAFEELDEHEEFRLREAAWDEYLARVHAEDAPILGVLDELGVDIGRLRGAYLDFANYPDVEEWPAADVEIDDALLERARTELPRLRDHAVEIEPELPAHAGTDGLIPFYRDLPLRLRNTVISRTDELMDLLEACASVKVVQKWWPGGQKRGKAEKLRWEAFTKGIAEPLLDQWCRKRYGPVLEVLRGAADHYSAMRAERGVVSYQDLLMKAAALLRDKPVIRAYFRRRFTHLLVDEFQDTDPVQAEVMLLLTSDDDAQTDWRSCTPRPGALFVVGDPKQSIYRFRRADIVTYNDVRRIIEARGRVVPLSANFRSTGKLIDWLNGVSPRLFPKAGDEYGPADSPLSHPGPGETEGDLNGILAIPVPEGLKGAGAVWFEANVIARTIRDALDSGLTVARRGGGPTPVTPGDFLVLTWAREPLTVYSDCLQDAGVPVDVTGSTAVNDVPEVRLLGALLAALVEANNPVVLVGVLRSELFGISDDELYRFKKGGGRFSIFCEEKLDEAERIAGALERLRGWSRWLAAMQPVAALERIAADAGLMARAAASPGGSPRAGGFLKAFELLRAAQRELWTPADLVAYLEHLVEPRPLEKHDGMPLRPHRDAVRVMNLHQAKGLEAPIVFLTQGAAKPPRKIDLHIDRRGGPARGYFAVRKERQDFGRGALIAAPCGWEALEEEELLFRDAEWNRLRYVAATRAGARLVVSPGPLWDKVAGAVPAGAVLAEPPEVAAPAPAQSLPPEAPAEFAAQLAERREHLLRPTYGVRRVKEIAVRGGVSHASAGEHGTEWGTVIHVLLEAAMARPGADLEALAEAALEEEELARSEAPRAVAIARAVERSDLWRRAQRSLRRLVEVPIQFLQPKSAAEPETIVRGVIDLVFREAAGWVIVDYKTDDRPDEPLEPLIDHYAPQVRLYAEAWGRLTGEPVVETGLFFVGTGRYVGA